MDCLQLLKKNDIRVETLPKNIRTQIAQYALGVEKIKYLDNSELNEDDLNQVNERKEELAVINIEIKKLIMAFLEDRKDPSSIEEIPARKRGRPKSVKEEYVDNDLTENKDNELLDEEIPVRKRGRPKSVKEEYIDNDLTENKDNELLDEEIPVRKRGRPKLVKDVLVKEIELDKNDANTIVSEDVLITNRGRIKKEVEEITIDEKEVTKNHDAEVFNEESIFDENKSRREIELENLVVSHENKRRRNQNVVDDYEPKDSLIEEDVIARPVRRKVRHKKEDIVNNREYDKSIEVLTDGEEFYPKRHDNIKESGGNVKSDVEDDFDVTSELEVEKLQKQIVGEFDIVEKSEKKRRIFWGVGLFIGVGIAAICGVNLMKK